MKTKYILEYYNQEIKDTVKLEIISENIPRINEQIKIDDEILIVDKVRYIIYCEIDDICEVYASSIDV